GSGAAGVPGIAAWRAAGSRGVHRRARRGAPHGHGSHGLSRSRRAPARAGRDGLQAHSMGQGGRRRMSSSRIASFYRLSVEERRRKIAEAVNLPGAEVDALSNGDGLPLEVADAMVENAVGTFALPFGVALNFQVNGRDYVVPMVVEEPSVIAAASYAALLARAG